MKKVIAILVAAVMMMTLMVGCGAKEEGKVLTVYTEAGFAPYEFISDGKVVGVDMAIMEKVAEKLGMELKISDVNFDGIIAGVKSGKADVGAAGITINDERKEEVDFSKPYSSTEQYLIGMKDQPADLTVEYLIGKKIGIQSGTTSDFLISDLIAEEALKVSEVVPYTAPALAAAAMAGGKVDAVVTDKLTAQIIVANNADQFQTYPLVGADGAPVAEVEEYGICVKKGNTEVLNAINAVLDEIMADGTLDKWMEDYTQLAKDLGIE